MAVSRHALILRSKGQMSNPNPNPPVRPYIIFAHLLLVGLHIYHEVKKWWTDNVTVLSSSKKCDQNLHSLCVNLHVDTTAHFCNLLSCLFNNFAILETTWKFCIKSKTGSRNRFSWFASTAVYAGQFCSLYVSTLWSIKHVRANWSNTKWRNSHHVTINFCHCSLPAKNLVDRGFGKEICQELWGTEVLQWDPGAKTR